MTGCMALGISILFSPISIYPDSWPVKLYPQSSHFHLLFLFCSDRHQRCYNSPARNMSSLKDQDTWLSHFQLIFFNIKDLCRQIRIINRKEFSWNWITHVLCQYGVWDRLWFIRKWQKKIMQHLINHNQTKEIDHFPYVTRYLILYVNHIKNEIKYCLHWQFGTLVMQCNE